MRGCRARLLAMVLTGCLPVATTLRAAENRPGERPDYLATVRAYADAMVERGRDVYGRERSPLFASALDRKTMKLGSRESFGNISGVRNSDRSLGGANPQVDAPLYAILYRLSELTGDGRYAAEADKALEFFFTRCQSPATGLMAWGEHLYWDFQNEARAGRDSSHEICGEWPFWDRCYRLAPEASWKFAIGQWDHQIADKRTGDFSRHARWSRHGPGKGADFPRYAGQMIVNWADAYAREENADRKRREDLVAAITCIVRRMEKNMKGTGTGYLIAQKGADYVWTGSNLELARCLWKAAPLMGGELAKRMRKLALRQDVNLHKAPHKVASGGGFAVTLHAETGEPRSRSMNKPYTATWVTGYGHGMHAGTANKCYARYRQLVADHGELARELAAKYRKLVAGAAEQYLAATPDAGQLQKPDALANVIDLMLNAHELTGEKRCLDRADHFGRSGIALFMGDGLPLPRATSQHKHYETITGGPGFMQALLRLHEALAGSARAR